MDPLEFTCWIHLSVKFKLLACPIFSRDFPFTKKHPNFNDSAHQKVRTSNSTANALLGPKTIWGRHRNLPCHAMSSGFKCFNTRPLRSPNSLGLTSPFGDPEIYHFKHKTLQCHPGVCWGWQGKGTWAQKGLSNRNSFLSQICLSNQWMTSWWLNQPIWKIWSSNWKSSPGRDENEKYWKPPGRWTWFKSSTVFLIEDSWFLINASVFQMFKKLLHISPEANPTKAPSITCLDSPFFWQWSGS